MISDMSQGRRRHPAKRARQITGTVAAGSAIALFGYFGVTNDASATTNDGSTTARSVTPPTTQNNTATRPSRRSQNLPATPSTTPVPIPNTKPYSRSGGS